MNNAITRLVVAVFSAAGALLLAALTGLWLRLLVVAFLWGWRHWL